MDKREDLIIEKLEKIESILNERLPETVPSFKTFAENVISEYWKLGGSFVNYETLKENVCAKMIISKKAFDIWFNDLVYLTAGKITVGESRAGTERVVHVLMKTKSIEELFWR